MGNFFGGHQVGKKQFQEEFATKNGVIVSVYREERCLIAESIVVRRGDRQFEECVKECMRDLLKDNLEDFKNMMREIVNDTRFFAYGEQLLEEERNKYTL